MAKLMIHRGTHQIGGCCTEITCNGERILIDLGSNLPDSDAPIQDDALISKVFDGRTVHGLLFTHPHGDHYGLYKKVPKDVPMYIGPMAKELLQVLVARLDYISEEKGLPTVERMKTYRAGRNLNAFSNIQILPIYVDHSAPDAYMFYIQAAGKKILFSGDFRDHGIVGERDRLWRTLAKYIPKDIDLLITEGTTLSRENISKADLPHTEKDLGRQAAKLFGQHKYNFVLVSSFNLDSIMEFYHHTPSSQHFVCDLYQAKIILTAMRGMEKKGNYPQYQVSSSHPVIRVLGQGEYIKQQCEHLRNLSATLKKPVDFQPVTSSQLYHDGFVMLVRKNSRPGKTNDFERMRNSFYPIDGKNSQIIYSMWDGYLKPEHLDQALLDYIGGRPVVHLHTSGHAYAQTIVKLIKAVNPKVIVPMHTERADEFASLPAFIPYKDRIRVLQDGEALSLDTL